MTFQKDLKRGQKGERLQYIKLTFLTVVESKDFALKSAENEWGIGPPNRSSFIESHAFDAFMIR